MTAGRAGLDSEQFRPAPRTSYSSIGRLDRPPAHYGRWLVRLASAQWKRGPDTRRSLPSMNGPQTVLIYQRVGSARYLDAAGFPERTVGVRDGKTASR
jgi:hypothetical protein